MLRRFTAEQARLFPDRLVGFLSIDPLLPSAVDEIRYWRDNPDLRGLKLHFSASAVDVHNPQHKVPLLAAVRQAATQNLAMLIHIGGGSFDRDAAAVFIRDILPATLPSWVQIAHAGGGVPLLADNLVDVLRTFGDHISADDPATRRVLFDLSYVPAPDEKPAVIEALVGEIRRIGMERFLFGSDFNVLSPDEQIRAQQRLGLITEELRILRSNCAPYVCVASPFEPFKRD